MRRLAVVVVLYLNATALGAQESTLQVGGPREEVSSGRHDPEPPQGLKLRLVGQALCGVVRLGDRMVCEHQSQGLESEANRCSLLYRQSRVLAWGLGGPPVVDAPPMIYIATWEEAEAYRRLPSCKPGQGTGEVFLYSEAVMGAITENSRWLRDVVLDALNDAMVRDAVVAVARSSPEFKKEAVKALASDEGAQAELFEQLLETLKNDPKLRAKLREILAATDPAPVQR